MAKTLTNMSPRQRPYYRGCALATVHTTHSGLSTKSSFAGLIQAPLVHQSATRELRPRFGNFGNVIKASRRRCHRSVETSDCLLPLSRFLQFVTRDLHYSRFCCFCGGLAGTMMVKPPSSVSSITSGSKSSATPVGSGDLTGCLRSFFTCAPPMRKYPLSQYRSRMDCALLSNSSDWHFRCSRQKARKA
jgi:hypothetical protein